MKQTVGIIILLAIIAYLIYSFGFNKCEKQGISKEAAKQTEVRQKIIYVKDEQAKIISQPDDIESRKRFIKLWREERFSSNK